MANPVIFVVVANALAERAVFFDRRITPTRLNDVVSLENKDDDGGLM
jgi:hypothetical protein